MNQHLPTAAFSRRPTRTGGRRVRIAFLLPLLLLPLAGCATKRDLRNLQATIQELHAQNQALTREIQREQRMVQDSLGGVARALQDFRGQTAGNFSAIQDQLFIVHENIGVSQQQMANMRDELERLRSSAALSMSGGGMGPVTPSAASELYESGVSAFSRSSYSSAQFLFEDLIANHASDPLVPHARYYLGLIKVEQGDPEGAIETFLEIAELHATSERAADALYQVGVLEIGAGNRSEGERYLNRVVEEHPQSGAAGLARQLLRDLR